jgi:4-aminobutyrate aminotransferase-like enzyme
MLHEAEKNLSKVRGTRKHWNRAHEPPQKFVLIVLFKAVALHPKVDRRGTKGTFDFPIRPCPTSDIISVRHMSIQARDKALLVRDSDADPVQVTRAEGSYVFDVSGRKYIDLFMGWCVGNFGWGHDEIKESIAAFKGPAYVAPQYLYEPWVELAELLTEITPGNLSKCVRTTTGTESIEAALQLARAYRRRDKFLAVEGSYHGNSIAVTSMSDGGKISLPLNSKAADRVETQLKKREYAAFIMEPIICNLGVHVPEIEFMRRVRELCNKYETLLILDEVACGFGRTGRLFASEHFGVSPDIMCMAKAITDGHVPLGATITTKKVLKEIGDDFTFYSTFGWHPLAVDAAITNIKYIKRHQTAILANVGELSDYFSRRLSAMSFKSAATLHIKGLAIGVQFEDAQYADKLGGKCRDGGVLLSTQDDFVLMWPALNMDLATAKRALDIVEESASSIRWPARRRAA